MDANARVGRLTPVAVLARVAILLAAATLAAGCGIDSVMTVDVVDELGRPIAEATVQIQALDEDVEPMDFRADASGHFAKELKPGRYRITAGGLVAGKAMTEVSVLPGVPLTVRLVLEGGR